MIAYTPYAPVIIAVLGLILYLASDSKPSEVGRICFFAGLLVSLLSLSK